MNQAMVKRSCLLVVVFAFVMMFAVSAHAQTTLQVAIVWGTEQHESAGFLAAAEAFERLHPGVKIEFISGAGWSDPGDGPTSKLMTHIAGGLSPDLAMVGGMGVPQFAHMGLLMPLDSYIQRSNVREEDFIPATWKQTQWLGKQYAMTLQVDPNFALVWQKDMFSEAGFDPDRGPQTLAEYEEHLQKLTRIGADGRATQLGHRVWDVYGGANTIYTWGWIFGGDFYDYENNVVTAADPLVVESLEYLRDYYERWNPAVHSQIRFPDGTEAMRFAVSANVKHWRQSFPDVEMGASLEPYKADSGAPNPSWIGGWAMGILPEAPNPDLAWEFLHFMTATPEGTDAFGRASGWIPAYLPSPAHEPFMDDPIMSVYLEIAQTARNMRPGMPVTGDYAVMLEEAFQDVMNGRKQPREALLFVQEQVQAKLDEALAQ